MQRKQTPLRFTQPPLLHPKPTGARPTQPSPKPPHAFAAAALDGPRHAHSSHRRSRGDRPGRCLGSQAGRHVAGMVEPKEYSQDAAKRALPGANLHRTPTREIGRPGRFPDAREPESQDTCPACRRRPADHAPPRRAAPPTTDHTHAPGAAWKIIQPTSGRSRRSPSPPTSEPPRRSMPDRGNPALTPSIQPNRPATPPSCRHPPP